ncbi:hypothetical protein MtrunA17_Chr1g0175791 [Medicago truncatula]|uniref:Uncharacterized protein n=1 Tax=Medicago truncatula TaxID=3880 RepID=A0A396JST5_MEDTR|nr:hypothetical protein MtrunA17_Chr1g0175791 [Medicago truncatula]
MSSIQYVSVFDIDICSSIQLLLFFECIGTVSLLKLCNFNKLFFFFMFYNVTFSGRMDSKSVKSLPERRSNRKRKVDHVAESPQETSTNVSPATSAKTGDGTSIWDDNFPFGDFVDKQFIAEKDCEAFDVWGLEKCSQVMLEDSVRSVFLVRSMGKMVRDLEKKNKACIEENTELKKLSEYEKDVGRLKENLEELSSEKSQLMEKEENLIEENSKIQIKLLVKEDIIGSGEFNNQITLSV